VTVFVRGQSPQTYSGTLVTASTSIKVPIGIFTR
jgi:hypothetical protein